MPAPRPDTSPARGRPPSLTSDQVVLVRRLRAVGVRVAQLAEALRISQRTVYRVTSAPGSPVQHAREACRV